MTTSEVVQPSGIGVCVLEPTILEYLKHLIEKPGLSLTLGGFNDLCVLANACVLFETVLYPNREIARIRFASNLSIREQLARWLTANQGWEFVKTDLDRRVYEYGHTSWYNDLRSNGPSWVRGERNAGGENHGNSRDGDATVDDVNLKPGAPKDGDLLSYLDLYAAMAESHRATLMSSDLGVEAYDYRQLYMAPQARVLKAYEDQLKRRIEQLEQAKSAQLGALDRYAPPIIYQALAASNGADRKSFFRALSELHYVIGRPYRNFFINTWPTKDVATRDGLLQEAERLLTLYASTDTTATGIGKRIKEKISQVLPPSPDHKQGINKALKIFHRLDGRKPTTFELYGELTRALGPVAFTRAQLNDNLAGVLS